MRNRVFRFLVCFALICCILVNCSPINVHATEVAVGAAGFGVLLCAMLMSCGVVYEPTNDFLNHLNEEGQAIIGEAIQNLDEAAALAADDEFRRTVIDRMYFSDDPDFDFDDGYEDDEVPDWGIKSGENNNMIWGASLAAVVSEWIFNVIQDGGFDVDGEAAPEGYSYYNGFLLPAFSANTNYPYRLIYVDNLGNYRSVASSNPGWCSVGSSSEGETWVNVSTNIVYKYVLDGDTWSRDGAFYPYQFGFSHRSGYNTLIWSNHDLCFSDGSVFLAGSEPLSTYIETLTPSTYFGDVPDLVRDGTYDEEDMPIPDVFNLQDIVNSSSSAYSDMQQIYDQIYNGDMSYQDYMDRIQAEDSTGQYPDIPDSGDSGDSDDGSKDDSEDESSNPIDVEGFVLALSSFFPFCIPHDLFELWSIVVAPPQAPVFEWVIEVPGGKSYEIVVDLSCWDPLAAFFRDLELLMFIFGLMWATKQLIKW